MDASCDYVYVPDCKTGKSHEADMKTKRETACPYIFAVNCLHCANVGHIERGKLDWHVAGWMPD